MPNLTELLKTNMIHFTLKFDRTIYQIRHLYIENLTKSIILLPFIPNDDQIGILYQLYSKFICIGCYGSKHTVDAIAMMNWVKQEYKELWDIPEKNDFNKHDTYKMKIF